MIDQDNSTVSLELISRMFMENVQDTASFFVGNIIIMISLTQIFAIEKEIYMQGCYMKIQIQREYCKYLNNLEEAVISKSNDGIRYFNTKGIILLLKSVHKIQNTATREKYLLYLESI
jgi:hypothetical protein